MDFGISEARTNTVRPPWLLYEGSSNTNDILGMFGHPFSNVTDNAEDFLSTEKYCNVRKSN